MGLKRSLPAGLLEGGSKEAIRLGAGFLSTLAALVIGLMIASAKNTYDTQNTNIRQLGTNAVLVDQMLTKYGTGSEDGAHPAAGNHSVGDRPDLAGKRRGQAGGSTFVVSETAERFYNAVEGLKPANDGTDLAEVAHHPDHHRNGPDAPTRVHPERQRDPGAVLRRAGVLAGGDLRKLQPVRRTECRS